jgi:hypothetical protein
MARDLARDAGLDSYQTMALVSIAGAIPAVILWRRRLWRGLGAVLVAGSLAFGAYFECKALLHNRSGVVSDPACVRWFAEDGSPRLWYARQPDGSLIFSNRPGFHYRTGQELKPVTAEIYKEWRQLKGLQDAQAEENLMLREHLTRSSAVSRVAELVRSRQIFSLTNAWAGR